MCLGIRIGPCLVRKLHGLIEDRCKLHFPHMWFVSNLICLIVISILTLYPPVIPFVTNP